MNWATVRPTSVIVGLRPTCRGQYFQAPPRPLAITPSGGLLFLLGTVLVDDQQPVGVDREPHAVRRGHHPRVALALDPGQEQRGLALHPLAVLAPAVRVVVERLRLVLADPH